MLIRGRGTAVWRWRRPIIFRLNDISATKSVIDNSRPGLSKLNDDIKSVNIGVRLGFWK